MIKTHRPTYNLYLKEGEEKTYEYYNKRYEKFWIFYSKTRGTDYRTIQEAIRARNSIEASFCDIWGEDHNGMELLDI